MIAHSPVVVQIAGTIGSGKTTLASLLSESMTAVLENFRAVPFWKAFYAEPGAHAFETEISFLLQHYHELKVAGATPGRALVCDWAFAMDEAYAMLGLRGHELRAFRSVLRSAVRNVPRADILVHLLCPPEVALERIRGRARPEERALPVEFVGALGDSVSTCVRSFRGTVLELDSHKLNFKDDEAIRSQVRVEISDAVRAVLARSSARTRPGRRLAVP